MNRIIATMAILVDAGVCTHRQNLTARDRGARENDGQFHDWREEFYQRLAHFACTIPQITRDARVRRGISCHKQRHRLARGKPGQVAHAHLEGIVSKRKAAPYRSGECRDWHKTKTAAWRTANPDPNPHAGRRRSWKLRGPRARRSTRRDRANRSVAFKPLSNKGSM